MNEVIVKGIDSQGRRISSKDFEALVQEAAAKSDKLILETYGQHNVGGRLQGGDHEVHVKGPCGQRLGCMGTPGTRIICHGSASDDVGYLNIGAEITVLGDATNGVCNAMAQGKVMIGGSIGARGLTMTKWNPDYERPELWVLGSVGDAFAEFNCGGIAVICGVEPKTPNSVLGYRPCVGMVGGWIYYRGKTDQTYSRTNVRAVLPDDEQWQWLVERLPAYLENINRMDLLEELSDRSQWKMLVAIPPREVALLFSGDMPMDEFRRRVWDKEFGGDPLRDLAPGLDRSPIGLIETGELRRRRPFWANKENAASCEYHCPVHIPTVERLRLLRDGKTREAYEMILEYTPLPASVCGQICPNLCMQNCSSDVTDDNIDISLLGQHSKDVPPPKVPEPIGRKVAVIGGGPAGMNAAWQLAREGVEAHIFEKDDKLGGKLAQIIPRERLPLAVWEAEIDRFLHTGNIHVHFNTLITRQKFSELQDEHDYVVVAVGAHEPKKISFPGHERVIRTLDFLKAAKSDNPPEIGKQVVIIGAGNMACHVACEAFRLGANEVTLVDTRKPAAVGKKKEAAEALGARFVWPVQPRKVTDEGLVDAADKLYPAQTVIMAIGDVPALDFLPETVEVERVGDGAWIKTDEAGWTSDPKVLAIGDVEKPGLATNALGRGKTAAHAIMCSIKGEKFHPFEKEAIDRKQLTHRLFIPDNCRCDNDEDQARRCMSCGACRDCHLCETICPTGAISRIKLEETGSFAYTSDDDKCIACGFCADICPSGVWVMQPY